MYDEVKEAVNRVGEGFDAFKSDYGQRLERLEIRADRDGMDTGRRSGETPAEAEHRKAFEAFVRHPYDAEIKSALAMAQKAVTGISDSGGTAGGYAVPEIIARNIAERSRNLNPMRSAARVEATSSANFKMLVNLNNAGSGWVGEGDSRSETDTPQLGEAAPTFGMVYAYPKASEESMNDIFFDVTGWLSDAASQEIGTAENLAFTTGNGSNKPTGFLDGTPSAAGDTDLSPARAFGTLQYVPTGVAGGFGSLSVSSPESYPADVLYTTIYTLRAPYRANARWMMNSTTAGVIRKFKDADGRYLWIDNLAEGQPPLLCGYPVEVNEAMPDIGANAFPVAFGDFRRGYLIADVGPMRITVDDNITTPGQVKFYVRRRVGGCVLDDDAIKLIKCAVS